MEKAAGFIMYRVLKPKTVEYLLLQASYGTNHWTPPKGHLENDEDWMAAAIRETEEEAGYKRTMYKILDNFHIDLNYQVKGKDKQVRYFVAKVLDPQAVTLSSEHKDLVWGDLELTKSRSGFEDMNKAFDKCHKFILEHDEELNS